MCIGGSDLSLLQWYGFKCTGLQMEGEFMRCKQILGVYFWVDLFSFMKVWAYADQNVVMNKGKLQLLALSMMSVCPFWSWAVVDF